MPRLPYLSVKKLKNYILTLNEEKKVLIIKKK